MNIITKVTVRMGGVKYRPGSVVEICSEREARSLIDRDFATEAPGWLLPDPADAPEVASAPADGSLLPEITSDGVGEPLAEAPPEGVAEAPPEDVAESRPIQTPEPEPTKPKRGKS